MAVAAVTGALFGAMALTGPADAAKCGAMPDGDIGDPTTPNEKWDSPGEVISYLNRNGIRSSTFEAPPGQLVKLLCAGAPEAP